MLILHPMVSWRNLLADEYLIHISTMLISEALLRCYGIIMSNRCTLLSVNQIYHPVRAKDTWHRHISYLKEYSLMTDVWFSCCRHSLYLMICCVEFKNKGLPFPQLVRFSCDLRPFCCMAQICSVCLSVWLSSCLSICIPFQTVILIILSFTYHRVRLCKKVLWGIPGLVMYVCTKRKLISEPFSLTLDVLSFQLV